MSLSNKNLKSFKITDLENIYNIPQIANEYTQQPYNIGDYVNYQGVIYRCTTQISVAESWNSSHWTSVMLADDIRDNYNDLKNGFNKSLDGYSNFGQYADFSHYGLNSDGTYKTNQEYRVSCDTHIILDRPISISVSDGFKWGYIYFNDGVLGGWKGWFTSDIALPSGFEFVIQIARVTENTSEVANVEEFLNAVTFDSLIGDVAKEAYHSITSEYIDFSQRDMTYGKWNNQGAITYSYSYLCVNKLIPIKKGDKFVYKTNNLQIAFGIYVNGSPSEYSGYKTSENESTYIFTQDGLFFVYFKNSNETALLPDDYDAVCRLYTGISNDIKTSKANTDADLGDLRSASDILFDGSYSYSLGKVDTTATGWALKDDGLCASNADYKLMKYEVVEGDVFKICSDFKFQFQTVASVPSSGENNRIGKTYGVGTFVITAPVGATYLIISTLITGSTFAVYKSYETASSTNYKLGYNALTFNYTNGSSHSSTTDLVQCNIKSGSNIYVSCTSFVSQIGGQIFAYYSDGTSDNLGTFYTNTPRKTYTASKDIVAVGFYIGANYDTQTLRLLVEWDEQSLDNVKTENLIIRKTVRNSYVPFLRNGSASNTANTSAVCTYSVLPINNEYDYVVIEYLGTDVNDEYAFSYCLFAGVQDDATTTEAYLNATRKKNVNDTANARVAVPYIKIPMSEFAGYDHVSFYLWRIINNVAVPLRIPTNQYCIRVWFGVNGVTNDRQIRNADIWKTTNVVRHIKGNDFTPLTILHFSDIHSDQTALARILHDESEYTSLVDDIICTGDMVAGTGGAIDSWWPDNVMTCIGNHDAASYNAETGYNWTAVSMVNRDAYYIAPFESNWDIQHTAGTSYYYKDYQSQKVRLIVMDTMLYHASEADTTLATAQTSWLANLLSDAITNELHVLIAIHSPHGGASAVDCSFSRYGQTTMPTWTDCNTPQTIIDTVATAITNGLHFIGYLVGHTHQDNIWNAEGDGKQLMYCVTCAAVSVAAQWKNSDQNRADNLDAYNIVTIDTQNTLVKIVRGGGADIDDHARTRKAICFNYSTGAKVAEVL